MLKGDSLEEKVEDVFRRLGFEVIRTKGIEYDISAHDSLQIDVIAKWKKICILIEATGEEDDLGKKLDRFHTRSKLVTKEILVKYIKMLNQKEEFDIEVDNYDRSDLVFLRLFIGSYYDLETMRDRARNLDPFVHVWDRDVLEYFHLLSKAIDIYGKCDLFGFFKIDPELVHGEPADIKTVDAIKMTSLGIEHEIYTFTIRALDLLKLSKIMRRDGWESGAFQRLVREKKLNKIRGYLLNEGAFFPNNIIVSLPGDVSFEPLNENNRVGKLMIPMEYGAMTIIDGQHRLLGYARSHMARRSGDEQAEKNDEKLRGLMKKHRLIVTGIRFGHDEEKERARIFVEINENQKSISKSLIYMLAWDVLDHKYPEAFASCILDELNSDGPFRDKIQMKEFQRNRIPRTSIIRYALKYLVRSDDGVLYRIAPDWVKESYERGNFEPFIKHCVRLINSYFKQIINVFSRKDKNPWQDIRKKKYMLTSTTSIVAFLRLYRHFFYPAGSWDKDEYFKVRHIDYSGQKRPIMLLKPRKAKELLDSLSDFSFDKDHGFSYTGSQWGIVEAVLLKMIRDNSGHEDFGNLSLITGTGLEKAEFV